MMRGRHGKWRRPWYFGLLPFAAATTFFAAAAKPESAPANAQPPGSPDPWITANLNELVSLYTHLHTHPELSLQEVETSKRIADELAKHLGLGLATDP